MLAITPFADIEEVQLLKDRILKGEDMIHQHLATQITPFEISITSQLLKLKCELDQEMDYYKRQTILQACSFQIIRFVSLLSDVNNKFNVDKNKSMKTVLSQEQVNMKFADILSEIRHSLTHKQIPSEVLIYSAINYILMYLDENSWPNMFKQPQVSIRTSIINILNGDDPLKQLKKLIFSKKTTIGEIILLTSNRILYYSDCLGQDLDYSERICIRKTGNKQIMQLTDILRQLLEMQSQVEKLNKKDLKYQKLIEKQFKKINIFSHISPNLKETLQILEEYGFQSIQFKINSDDINLPQVKFRQYLPLGARFHKLLQEFRNM
ncbi:hypothetical protein pb186bvf_007790 [Paramecium bursaria]